jgi:OmpA-OmpF porin, OOP family
LFDTDKAILKPAAVIYINKVISTKTRPRSVIVYGHTDSVGTAGYNIGLAARRPSAVASFLVAAKFVGSGNVVTMPMGATQPIDTNATEVGRAHNRRVEIEFY